jgi:hypothetical protein
VTNAPAESRDPQEPAAKPAGRARRQHADTDAAAQPTETEPTPTEVEEGPSDRELLELAAKAAAVTAVALPVIGFFTRAVAFSLCGRLDSVGAWHLAADTSLGNLTVAGIWPVIVGVPLYVAAFVSARKPRKPPTLWAAKKDERGKTYIEVQPMPEGRQRSRRETLVWAVTGTVIYGGIGLAVFFLPLVAYPLAMASITIGTRWMRRIYAKRGNLRLAWAWPVLVGSLLWGAVVVAAQYDDVPAAQIALDASSKVPSGRYLVVGEDGPTTFLLSCTDESAEPVSISTSSILRADYLHRKRAETLSVFTIVTGKTPPLGLQTQCP